MLLIAQGAPEIIQDDVERVEVPEAHTQVELSFPIIEVLAQRRVKVFDSVLTKGIQKDACAVVQDPVVLEDLLFRLGLQPFPMNRLIRPLASTRSHSEFGNLRPLIICESRPEQLSVCDKLRSGVAGAAVVYVEPCCRQGSAHRVRWPRCRP